MCLLNGLANRKCNLCWKEIDLTHANLAWMADVILKQMYLHLDIISWHIEADSNLGTAYVTHLFYREVV